MNTMSQLLCLHEDIVSVCYMRQIFVGGEYFVEFMVIYICDQQLKN